MTHITREQIERIPVLGRTQGMQDIWRISQIADDYERAEAAGYALDGPLSEDERETLEAMASELE